MIRTQIHLAEEDMVLLDREAARTGASRAELVRRAVQAVYGSSRRRPPITSIGVVMSGEAVDPDRLDEELGEILDEKFRRPS